MNKMYARSLFLFHRDLRCDDNCGLRAACLESAEVMPAFILDPRQIEPHPYRSEPALAFLQSSLTELDDALRDRGSHLHVFHGKPIEVLARLKERSSFDAVYSNRDYTPFARKRDREIAAWAQEAGVAFHLHRDLLLTEPEEVHKPDGTPYTVYTPFAKRAVGIEVAKVRPLVDAPFVAASTDLELPLAEALRGYRLLPRPFRKGGRKEGLALMESLARLNNYSSTRDLPADEHGTSGLSPHLKFGTLSPREVYHQVCALFGSGHLLVRELLWRDFFHHIAWHFPHVFTGAFHARYDGLAWRNDEGQFARWQEGCTGFPIVDAGMRQLAQSGFMHNRVRMIVASFLTKDLQIDWHWGERHFATLLLDYDPCVNNGNWQWAASTGCDAQPYFRIFNPWLQQKKFDPQCVYIKRWIPELRALAPETLHTLYEHPHSPTTRYPPPMLDHSDARLLSEEMYAAVAKEGAIK